MDILWKNLSDFPRYSVSSEGEVYDNQLKRILPLQKTSDGYAVVTLRDNNGCRKTVRVHRLVAETFIPNPENKETVNHKNGVKLDNSVENLEWNTRSENTQHAWDNGLIKDLESRKIGIRSKQGKKVICTTTGVIYNSIGEAAEKLNLQKTNISAVCRGKKGFKSAGKTEDGVPMKWEFYYEQD